MEAFLRGALGRVQGATASGLAGKTLVVGEHRVRVGAALASGGFGYVYLASDAVRTDIHYALKHIMPGESVEALEVARAEVAVSDCLCDHPHAVRLLAATPRPPQLRTDCLLLMELCQESLATVLQSRTGGLEEKEALQVCRAVTSVLAALHAAGICHWDVKPENVLRAGDTWKVCDFGSSTRRSTSSLVSARERGQLEDIILRRTTPAYRAPELWDLKTNASVGPAADVWALGCLLGAALGAPPFRADDKLRVLQAAFKPPPRASAGVVALQRRALAASPEARPTALLLLDALDELLAAGGEPVPLVEPSPTAPPEGPGWEAHFD